MEEDVKNEIKSSEGEEVERWKAKEDVRDKERTWCQLG